jgi:hypothetical protein
MISKRLIVIATFSQRMHRWQSPLRMVPILNKVRLCIVPLCANQFELSIGRMAV